MGKIRRKFNEGFKEQIVGEIEMGGTTLSAAARKYQLSPSLLVKWRRQMVTELLKKLRTSLQRRKNGNFSGLIAPAFTPSVKAAGS